MSTKRKRGSTSPRLRVIREATVEASGEAGAGGEVGRLVDSSQAEDRRMIALVRERRMLYARNNMPVASYYAQVKTLWQEVADQMGWTVAEVRRKWSHVRNSYSRHLRNEMYGVRTGRGRVVSRWYLADELDFLRDHMATDTRPTTRYPYPSLYAGADVKPKDEMDSSSDSIDLKPFLSSPWFTPLAGAMPPEAAPEPVVNLSESSNPGSFGADENAAYFQFFRGIFNDYQELDAPRQRLFRRECLGLLHRLLDAEGEEGAPAGDEQEAAINLSHPTPDSDEDNKFCVIAAVKSQTAHGTTSPAPH